MHFVVFPQRIDKERLHHLLSARHDGIYGIQEIGIVHHYLGGFLRKFVTRVVNHIYESCIGQILYIVHHRSPAGRDVVCQIAYIGCFRHVQSQQIEQLLDLGEIFQLNLLDEQDVHLGHHIHRLEQILLKVPVLKKERVEAVVQIAKEIFWHIATFAYYIGGYVHMMFKNVVKAIDRQTAACEQVQEFAE